MGPAGGNTVGRLGVFGGSFDPPHAAHQAMAQAALAQLHLDRLLVVPTGQAYHKARSLSPAAHRLAMCEAVWGGTPRVQIDPRETQRERPSYTVETLTELRAQWPGAQIFLLMGADQWSAFTTWKDWRRILDMSTVVLTPPRGLSLRRAVERLRQLMISKPMLSFQQRDVQSSRHLMRQRLQLI